MNYKFSSGAFVILAPTFLDERLVQENDRSFAYRYIGLWRDLTKSYISISLTCLNKAAEHASPGMH